MAAPLSARPPLLPLLPWTDRQGRLSWLRLAVFLALLAPAAWYLGLLLAGGLRPDPARQLTFLSGEWAVWLLLVTLAVTPLRRITGWNRLAGLRRMLGLSALAYAGAHLLLYVVREHFDLLKVGSEILLRPYLTLGFAALAVLVALGATSTDGAIRRLGPRWHRLHGLVHVAAALALVHFHLQAKSDVFAATLTGGLFLLLMGYRLAVRLGLSLTRPAVLAALALLAGLATAGLEHLWYALATGLPAWRVSLASLDPAQLGDPGLIRPAWWVLLAGLSVTLLPFVRGVSGRARPL
ncbi:sulfoxide reductase heme-binding subunit YedZ [Microvirga tunisiensis]|uniref:Protein-methionine-sulfoxide reductase heme-binding subunit MsrQ n=1 Tax=Pannonibacter tanglangensis TaxID=2750084 RepID=A0A7X5F5R7_9HYPH|nr:protein-methionine-sulfoxide reductase heme-binding subunit MsrQ [Pannonibacter sp. XCT-53]NBN80272.1 sulfoxide reductase heme-binding subunit YedZ [Pannonibacter sp. XCT-53]